MSENENIRQTWESYCANFAQGIRQNLLDINNIMNSLGSYNPMMGQDYTQQINISPRVPSQDDLTNWLKNPAKFSKELRDVGQYLEGAINQYARVIDHFSKILEFHNNLRAIDVPITEEEKTKWKNGYNRCLEFLRKFNLKYQASWIVKKAISEGGIFTYLQKTDNFETLIEINSDYCYLTGRWDWGWTYAINLSYFDRYVGLKDVIPELYEYYKIFIKMREAGLKGQSLIPYQYYHVPIDRGFVFTFNPFRAQITPPLAPIFKDALEILTYKALLKQRTALDTWKIVAQQIPKTDAGEPAIPVEIAQQIIQMTQLLLPSGVRTFATPMEVKEVNFNQSQSQNNIIGLGEQLFWQSAGVNGSLMDLTEKNAIAQKYSIINDYNYVRHLYFQFENFINLQLLLKSRDFRFRISLYGNSFTDQDDMKTYAELVRTTNFPIGKLLGYHYEPYEIDAVIEQEDILRWKDKLKPIIAGSQMSGKGGAPTKSDGELADGGITQRDYDSNNSSK